MHSIPIGDLWALVFSSDIIQRAQRVACSACRDSGAFFAFSAPDGAQSLEARTMARRCTETLMRFSNHRTSPDRERWRWNDLGVPPYTQNLIFQLPQRIQVESVKHCDYAASRPICFHREFGSLFQETSEPPSVGRPTPEAILKFGATRIAAIHPLECRLTVDVSAASASTLSIET